MILVDTRKAIRKLALRNLKKNRVGNAVAVLVVAASFFVIATGSFLLYHYILVNDLRDGIYYSAATHVLHQADEHQVQAAKQTPYITQAGVRRLAGQGTAKWEDLFLYYSDQDDFQLFQTAVGRIKGVYPGSESEILLSKRTLLGMGIEKPEVGQKITIEMDTEDGPAQGYFILSGWYTGGETGDEEEKEPAFISESYYQMNKKAARDTADVYIQTREEISADELRADLDVSEEQHISVLVKVTYIENRLFSYATAAVAGVIILFGYMLMHHIFYIAAVEDMRNYGLLKTIGMSKRQIRLMFLWQARFILAVGLLIGTPVSLVAGLVIGRQLSSIIGVAEYYRGLILGVMAAAVMAYVMMAASIRKASRLGAQASPLESVKRLERKWKVQKAGKKRKHNIAFQNVWNDKRKLIIISISFTVGIVLFIQSYSFLHSLNITAMAKRSIVGDINIVAESVLTEQGSEWQMITEMDEGMLAEVEDMDGVSYCFYVYEAGYQLKEPEYFDTYYEFVGTSSPEAMNQESIYYKGSLIGVTAADLKALGIDDSLAYDFEAGKTALLGTDYAEIEIWPERFEIDMIDSGERVELKTGYADTSLGNIYSRGDALPLLVSKTMLDQHCFELRPIQMVVGVREEMGDDVEARIRKLVSEKGGLHIETLQELEVQTRGVTKFYAFICYGIVFVLFFLGIFHFLSVTITGLLYRDGELAVLESIGMTKLQIRKMLVAEGIWYGGIPVCLSLSLSVLIYHLIMKPFSEHYHYMEMCFPYHIAAGSAICIFLITAGVPAAVYKYITRTGLTERLQQNLSGV